MLMLHFNVIFHSTQSGVSSDIGCYDCVKQLYMYCNHHSWWRSIVVRPLVLAG